jgi:alpha-L-rhamnosidase
MTQTAYQILVASSPALLAMNKGDLWESGRIASDQTTEIAYAGEPLHSSEAVWRAVRICAGDGRSSALSAPASLLGDDNSTVLLRHDFAVKPGLKRALVHVCGLGQYEMTVNGKNPMQSVLNPGWTNYKRPVCSIRMTSPRS